ncbi:hypothetical protein O6H91_Y050800 [Diphasiastrum complanatum]|nr:hypothetical protein O6H91_Y050800 [Diphasiastrum complanatum]
MKDRSNWNHALAILEDFHRESATPLQRLQQIVNAMLVEMRKGLAAENESTMKMLITHINSLPTGDEKGVFYALDLGGTNFRVLRVQLGGKKKGIVQQDYEEKHLPSHLMTGTNTELFDYVASELANFVSEEGTRYNLPRDQTRELGVTFSFPVKQNSVASGTLINWTKGFAVTGTVGKDVVEELQAAMVRRGLKMRVAALVNDTVGTLARGRYVSGDVMIAVILGTGTNACYLERVDAIPKMKDALQRSGNMVINMEWGNFSSSFLPRTKIDDALDMDSINPGYQSFEKLVSGMYLGEIVRRLLLKLAREADFFGENVPPKLTMSFILSTPNICSLHQDDSSDLQMVAKTLEEVLEIRGTSLEVRQIVVEVCDIVARRGARLSGSGIVAILKKLRRSAIISGDAELHKARLSWQGQRTIVAVDGGLYEHYPKYREYMQAAVVELVGEQTAAQVSIEFTNDGSGIGAALLAACYSEEATP